MAASKGFAVKRLSLTPSTTLGGGGEGGRKREVGMRKRGREGEHSVEHSPVHTKPSESYTLKE